MEFYPSVAWYIFPEIDTSIVTRNKLQPSGGLGRGVTKDKLAKRPGKHLWDFFSVESLREEVNEEISSEDIADTILTELRRINPKRVGNVSPDVFFMQWKC